jgi:GNAT superfamily N-acetyltransferase
MPKPPTNDFTPAPIAVIGTKHLKIISDQGRAVGIVSAAKEDIVSDYFGDFTRQAGKMEKWLREHVERVAILKHIEVDDDFRGQGYGKALMLQFTDEVAKAGCKVILLVAKPEDDPQDGFDLQQWYENMGCGAVVDCNVGQIMAWPAAVAAKLCNVIAGKVENTMPRLPVEDMTAVTIGGSADQLSFFLSPIDCEGIRMRLGKETIKRTVNQTDAKLIVTQGELFKTREASVRGLRYLYQDDRGDLVGVANVTLIGRRPVLSNIYVRPDKRCTGIAGFLVAAARSDYPKLTADTNMTEMGAAFLGYTRELIDAHRSRAAAMDAVDSVFEPLRRKPANAI